MIYNPYVVGAIRKKLIMTSNIVAYISVFARAASCVMLPMQEIMRGAMRGKRRSKKMNAVK